MSLATIILGLLIWYSFPALYEYSISRKSYHYLRLGCKFVGIIVVAAGVISGIF